MSSIKQFSVTWVVFVLTMSIMIGTFCSMTYMVVARSADIGTFHSLMTVWVIAVIASVWLWKAATTEATKQKPLIRKRRWEDG